MKNIIIAIVACLTLNAMAARTLDQELSRTKAKFVLKQMKKAKKDAIKAKYKEQIEAIKDKQAAEIDSVVN